MSSENFFIYVLPKKLQIEKREFGRIVVGKDNLLNKEWFDELKKKYVLKEEKDSFNTYYFTVNNSVEFKEYEIEKSSKYIVLIGCYSCFDYAISIMKDIVTDIEIICNSEIEYDVLNKRYVFSAESFSDSIKNGFKVNFEYFQKTYRNANFVVPPSRFYKEYNGIIPNLKRKLKNIFKSNKK